MEREDIRAKPDSNWFVGASYGESDDQTDRFVRDGIWENGYDDKYLDLVRSMRPGDRIAIKSSYIRKNNLGFDNRDNAVSVMAIKAVGEIIDNMNDGKRVRVKWEMLESKREWFFYTYRPTVWRVVPGDWKADGLLAFTFDEQPQDIDRFRNAPYWRDRFGDVSDNHRFIWTSFYEDIADKLLQYRHNRAPLVDGIHQIGATTGLLSYLQDKFEDGSTRPLQDICPFTALGIFNRGLTVENRKAIAGQLARLLDVKTPVPKSFNGIPVLNNQRSWFFEYSTKRKEGDIDAIWRVFYAAKCLVEFNNAEFRDEFLKAYDAARQVSGIAWNLSTGLYWARPWHFVTMDSRTREYITQRLGFPPLDALTGKAYLKLNEDLSARFQEEDYPVHSFPELSEQAWLKGLTDDGPGSPMPEPPIEPYSAARVLDDGCFLERSEVERLLERLRIKKNLILQGPPGTGKTWIAKRLAYALMGEKNDKRIRAVQFHPNLSYEDFVRGWRPTGNGHLVVKDGAFMEVIHDASQQPSSVFVVVIEEINRGNPAQVFGELLTLIEAGKRTPNEALELSYPDADGNRLPVHIPENLYVIGTMNIADRSLALVDLAFRRRFAFVTLKPELGDQWRSWVVDQGGLDPNLVQDIADRITALNEMIAEDLGNQFRIGHSYVTPTRRLEEGSTRAWFSQVAESEIGPLLEEYWFDSPKRAKEALEELVSGW